LDSESVVATVAKGDKALLVRSETSPDDIEGMAAAEGILTAVGGATSHAAVVARGMGVCCISGMGALKINEKDRTIKIGDKTFKEGDYLSLDGDTGKVYEGRIPTIEAKMSGDFGKIIQWADEIKDLKVVANADTPQDYKKALELGAKGIGLCRTEHMFFESTRIASVRKMILAADKDEREKYLNELLPYQYEDFVAILTLAPEYKTTIRLLDPPLHEFLPHDEADIKDLARSMGVSFDVLLSKVHDLKEFNPMLGHRGCRLAVTYPEIYLMQTRAIVMAAVDTKATAVEIMVPLVGNVKEYRYLKALMVEAMEQVFVEKGKRVPIKLGTMIEVPRATMVAAQIAKEADFFSYGTNDLTQMTYGFSRDDATKFIGEYQEKRILDFDPFKTIDVEGVGALVAMSVTSGRAANPELAIGVCGEHGGDPKSIEFFHAQKFETVSCSPFRVPVAIVAAAQATIASGNVNPSA
jgi:pyruvate,orthophosphate dikinase